MPPSNSSADKTIALITGANQGIGFEIAKLLVKNHPDFHIILAGRRPEALSTALSELKTLKPESSVSTVVLDLTSDESIVEAAAHVKERFGRLDVLVNNAGINHTSTAGLGLSKRAELTKLFDTNVFGTIITTEAFLPLLKASTKTKRIVLIGSSLSSFGRKTDPTLPSFSLAFFEYGASKAAGHYIAVYYGTVFANDPSWKINIHCPGVCATNMTGFDEGSQDPAIGAINAVRLATLGPEGETLTFSDLEGPVPW